MENYIGEIRAFSFGRIPEGWAACKGQILNISENPTLFSLIGNQFGGNGQSTFALPDLQGRVAFGVGIQHPTIGMQGGSETVRINTLEMAAHTHIVNASDNSGTDALNQDNDYLARFSLVPATPDDANAYIPYTSNGNVFLNPQTVDFKGGGQAHENRMPYQTINYCIALEGQYPSRS